MKVKVIVILLCFVVCPILSFAAQYDIPSFETQTVFVPEIPKKMLEDWLVAGHDIVAMKEEYEEKGQKISIKEIKALVRKKVKKVIAPFVDDINQLTKDGWEIKSARRVWVDMPPAYNNTPNVGEWGTEYVLQRRVK